MKNKSNLCVWAVIAGAGKGSRMSMDINKQYIEIDGIPILARTLIAFEQCEEIDGIVLVVNVDDIIWCRENIIDRYNITKAAVIVAGGQTRQASVYNGLKSLDGECDIVLVHDGVRPFINNSMIVESIYSAWSYGACCVAVPVKDTIKQVDDQEFVVDTPKRDVLWAVQTPQAFKYDVIVEAHRQAIKDGFLGTDDAMLVERLEKRIKIITGSYDNIKITTKDDLILAEAFCLRLNC